MVKPFIDGNEGLWKSFVIGANHDGETSLMMNHAIPFGFVDFRDLGRTGLCGENNAGRIFIDENGNKHIYKDFTTTILDCNNVFVTKRDNRIPVEALLPIDRCGACDEQSTTCTTDDCTGEKSTCPQKTLQIVCENGQCITKWGPALSINTTGCIAGSYDYATNSIDLELTIEFEESDSISIEEVKPEKCVECPDAEECQCPKYKFNLKTVESCTNEIVVTAEGVKVVTHYMDSDTVDIVCVEKDPTDPDAPHGLQATVRVCSGGGLTTGPDGICINLCESGWLDFDTEGRLCLAPKICEGNPNNILTYNTDTGELCALICTDSTMCLDEDGCLRARIWTRDFFAGIKDKPTNISPTEQAAHPEIDFTLYFAGFAGNPADAPINATRTGQCVKSMEGILEFDTIEQPPFPAPKCMEWRMELSLQANLSNPVEFPAGVQFPAPISFNVMATVNGSENGIAGRPYVDTMYLQPGYGLPLYNGSGGATGYYPALDSGNTVGIEVEYCFPENNPAWPEPTAVCFGNESFVSGRYYLVPKDGETCCY